VSQKWGFLMNAGMGCGEAAASRGGAKRQATGSRVLDTATTSSNAWGGAQEAKKKKKKWHTQNLKNRGSSNSYLKPKRIQREARKKRIVGWWKKGRKGTGKKGNTTTAA